MSQVPVPLVLLVALAALPVSLAEPAGIAPTPNPPVTVAPGDHFSLRLDTSGTGWAMVDIRAAQDMQLHFHLSHDTIPHLCALTREGHTIYGDGAYTAVHLWKPADGNPFHGRFFTWLGRPHLPLAILQTGACGASEPIPIAAGETARLVVASSVPGYHIELAGARADDPQRQQTLPLAPHPDLILAQPEPTATVHVDTRPVVALEKRWQHGFDTGPAAFYGLGWVHAAANDTIPTGAYQDVAVRDWGFDGADFSGSGRDQIMHRGSLAADNDWSVVFPGWTTGGQVDGFVHEQVLAGAYASTYETDAAFLSVPLSR